MTPGQGLRWRQRRLGQEVPPGHGNPFAVLGLDAGADLHDDDVRVAWRRIAAATHPDRADGGDLERFAAAAAAYTDLRTRYGRGEARAALSPETASTRTGGARTGGARTGGARTVGMALLGEVAVRVRLGRPVRLLLRVIGAAGAAAVGILAAGPGPAAPALATGILSWLLLTARRDLGPPSDG